MFKFGFYRALTAQDALAVLEGRPVIPGFMRSKPIMDAKVRQRLEEEAPDVAWGLYHNSVQMDVWTAPRLHRACATIPTHPQYASCASEDMLALLLHSKSGEAGARSFTPKLVRLLLKLVF